MKKSKLFIPIALLFAFALSGCVMLTSERLPSSNSKVTSSSGRPSSSSSEEQSSSEQGSEYEETEVDVSACETMYVDELSVISSSSFSTNFGVSTASGIDFGVYRGGRINNYLGVFYANAKLNSEKYDYSLHGSVSNENPIAGIRKIEFNYQSTGPVRLYFGQTKDMIFYKTFEAVDVDSYGSLFIHDDANFFRLEVLEGQMLLVDFTIYYDGHVTEFISDLSPVSVDRIPFAKYSGTLQDGVSSVTVPTKISVNKDGKYTVKQRKTYTYYSFDYVQANAAYLDLDSIALIDPVDVANYFMAFGAAPANYANQKNCNYNPNGDRVATKSEASTVFGYDNVIGISQYNRTGGYSSCIPVRNSGESYYYELDLKLNSKYTISNRETCRLVCYYDGFTCYDETQPVTLYTDDHYNCFREYSNFGTFGESFDTYQNSSSFNRSNCVYENGKTLVQA